MGNPKQKWTSEEEEALRAGVNKHGVGKWKLIQKDPEFNHLLYSRSNIDLKDKWRNLFSNGHGPRDKSRTPKAMGEQTETPATPVPVAQMPASITPSSQDDASIDVVMVDSSTDVVMVDSSSPLPEGHNAAKYNAMIYETLSTLNQPNGSDFNGIANFIEQRQEVPHKFRRILSSRLRKLVLQGKLEKVQNCYKINKDAPLDTKKPASQQKEVQPIPRAPVPINAYVAGDSLEEAAVTSAYRIAEAENKSFVAAEAGKEAERVATMAEEMEALLQFATYCFEQCERGEILLKA